MAHAPHLFIGPTRIGDAVLASSVLRHIADNEPHAKVTIVTSPLSAPLFEAYPNLERIIAITKKTYSRHWLDVWRATSATRWDTLWDMRGSAMPYVLRAKHRRLFRGSTLAEPKVKQYERQLKTGPLPYPILWTNEVHRSQAEQRMPTGEKYLVLAPIANWAPKEWKLENFRTAARTILAKGYRPVIVCAAHERAKAQPLIEALASYNPVDLTDGVLPLLGVYACMERAHGFIGNDSGLMHMAAAAGIPTLGVFGPTPAEIYQPWGERAAFIRAPENDLAQLSPQAVVEKFNSLV
jgi:ADP-heptose:LPS heptosyltransferase